MVKSLVPMQTRAKRKRCRPVTGIIKRSCFLSFFILYFRMQSKIKTIGELQSLLDILRATGTKIVFTNGCFDLIHTGHTRYLALAKSFGGILVVTLYHD